MTMTQITMFFFQILIAIVIAMIVHSYLDKSKIRKRLLQLVAPLNGHVSQATAFDYPRFRCELNGRTFDLFFNVVQVGRHHILYSIYSLSASLTHPMLLVKRNEFRPVADPEIFAKVNGEPLTTITLPFQGYSLYPVWAKKIYLSGDVSKLISSLDEFSSLQLGPDALVAGKPYEGLADADSEKTLQAIKLLNKLAQEMETCTV